MYRKKSLVIVAFVLLGLFPDVMLGMISPRPNIDPSPPCPGRPQRPPMLACCRSLITKSFSNQPPVALVYPHDIALPESWWPDLQDTLSRYESFYHFVVSNYFRTDCPRCERNLDVEPCLQTKTERLLTFIIWEREEALGNEFERETREAALVSALRLALTYLLMYRPQTISKELEEQINESCKPLLRKPETRLQAAEAGRLFLRLQAPTA